MNTSLSQKSAMVCGSTAGIGKAIAVEFADSGASVTLVARNEIRLKEVLSLLPTRNGQKHAFIVANFEQPHLLQQALDQHFSGKDSIIDILVNNSGGPPPGMIVDTDLEAYRVAFNVHVICCQILLNAVLPGMKKRRYGRVINIISGALKEPHVGLAASGVARGAVGAWAKLLSKEIGPLGITVNNILPGTIRTGRIDQLISDKAKRLGKTEEEVEQEMLKAIPLGRFGEPKEVAHLAAYLASDLSAYMNGASIPVDGGRLSCL